MAVELDGNVRMRGHTDKGVGVRVLAGDGRLKLVSGNELIGEWQTSEIGVVALQEGFSIRAEGEEFVLITEDDVVLAEELNVHAASPRLARRIAARNNPDEPPPRPEPVEIPSNLAAIGFALAGLLVVLGGFFLNMTDAETGVSPLAAAESDSGARFWLAFVIGGVLMTAVAYVMSIGTRSARTVATVLLVAVIALFGWTVATTEADSEQITAYGFIAGGVVVGVAVLVSGSLKQSE